MLGLARGVSWLLVSCSPQVAGVLVEGFRRILLRLSSSPPVVLTMYDLGLPVSSFTSPGIQVLVRG